MVTGDGLSVLSPSAFVTPSAVLESSVHTGLWDVQEDSIRSLVPEHTSSSRSSFGTALISPAALQVTRPHHTSIQAYAKLEFESFPFFVQTLSVVLGRARAEGDGVDVHLGSTKVISRRHAKLFYNFAAQQFELLITGRNGAFVNDYFVDCGMTIGLVHGTRIQIGEVPLTFLLPPPPLPTANASWSEHEEQASSENEDQPNWSLLGTPATLAEFESYSPSSGSKHKPEHYPLVKTEDESEGRVSREEEEEELPPKPVVSYAQMIETVLQDCAEDRVSLTVIHAGIQRLYPYYQMVKDKSVWKAGVRQSLSSNKLFSRHKSEDKGMLWGLAARQESGGADTAVEPSASAWSMSPPSGRTHLFCDRMSESQTKKRKASAVEGAVPAAAAASSASSTSASASASSSSRTGSAAAHTPPLVVRSGQVAINPRFVPVGVDLASCAGDAMSVLVTVLEQHILGHLNEVAQSATEDGVSRENPFAALAGILSGIECPGHAAAIANALAVALAEQLGRLGQLRPCLQAAP